MNINKILNKMAPMVTTIQGSLVFISIYNYIKISATIASCQHLKTLHCSAILTLMSDREHRTDWFWINILGSFIMLWHLAPACQAATFRCVCNILSYFACWGNLLELFMVFRKVLTLWLIFGPFWAKGKLA